MKHFTNDFYLIIRLLAGLRDYANHVTEGLAADERLQPVDPRCLDEQMAAMNVADKANQRLGDQWACTPSVPTTVHGENY